MDQYERRKILDEVSNRREIVLSAEEKYPVIMLRGMVVFPNSHVNFDVSRKPSVKALQIAQKNGGKVVLVSQKNPDIEAPNEDDLYRMGTLCTIESISTETENSMRVLVKGEVRKRIDEFVFRRGFVEAYVSDVTETVEDEQLEESCLRIIMRMMMEYVKLMPQMPQEIFLKISDTKNSGDFADNVASNIVARFTDAQELLEELVIDKRLDKLVGILAREIDLLKVENRIMNEVKQQIDNSQREYFLREQLKAIERELGEEDDDYTANPVTEYKEKIAEMVNQIHRAEPDCSIVLVATSVPNNETEWFYGNQKQYIAGLREMEEDTAYPFVAVADMTTFHLDLLDAGKRFRDMTGNNINHPNDFLVRAYAQIILKTMLGDNFTV